MDIHVPSAAGSSSGSTTNLDGKSAMELMTEKDKIEAELKALGEVLDSHRVNMNTSLTTFDGYPRDDIDVAQIRITRARIIHLRNDWKALMDRIEKALHSHFASQDGNGAANPNPEPNGSVPHAETTRPAQEEPLGLAQDLKPFAKVNSVVSNSPADTAGLQAGDLVLKFGDVNWLNHEKLSRVARVVQGHEGRDVAVIVSRQIGTLTTRLNVNLTLTPRSNWGGKGLLGCHLLPL